MKLTLNIIILIFALFALPRTAKLQFLKNSFNGFDVSKSSIPKEDIFSGGPPRDGIPAILHPKFESREKAKWLKDNDLVTGIDFDGIQKAYPLRILVWHEAVNDEINGVPILVSYCPLCGSTLVFKREFSRQIFTFGISGLLYQSDVLFYDHNTESLWSQLEMKAVTGDMMGTKFQVFPSVLATWKEWKTSYPETIVLSRDAGFHRDYNRDPYAGYEDSASIMFPLKHSSNRFHPKEKVFVVISGEIAKAYPFSELKKIKTPFEDNIGDKKVVISFRDGNYVEAKDEAGDRIESFVSYWFAWYAFRPDTIVFTK